MKKIFISLAFILSLISLNITPIYAEEYYYEETIEIISTSQTRATNTKTGSKIAACKNSSGEVQWTVTVTGTFTYNGTSSTCTKASVSTKIVNDIWRITSASSSKSSNKAIATATAKRYLLGVELAPETKTVTLTCDKNGNLS